MKNFDPEKSSLGIESAIPFVVLFFALYFPMLMAINWDINYIFGAIPIGILLIYFYYLRRFTYLRNLVLDSYSNIDVQLNRRHDLVLELCEVIKRFNKYESDILKDLKKDGYHNVILKVEKYPVIKSDPLFLEMQDELGDCEDELAAAREIYNDNVRIFNNFLESFPGGVVGNINGFRKMGFWEDELKN